jgi:hypothetical protein
LKWIRLELVTDIDNATRIWEIQSPDETSKAFAAFCSYRNLPANMRSIDAAWRRVRSSELDPNDPEQLRELTALPKTRAPKTWRDWSVKNEWVYRTLAWDVELDVQARKRLIASHKQMLERHQQMGSALLTKAAERLLTLTPDDLEARDVAAFIKVGVSTERQAFELPDSIVETRHSGSVDSNVRLGGALDLTGADASTAAYDTIIRILLEGPEAALIAADRSSGRMAPTSRLPCPEDQPGEALPNPAP